MVGSALGLAGEPAALTDGEGSLLIANAPIASGSEARRPPLELGADEDAGDALADWRGRWRGATARGCVGGVATAAGPTAVEVERVGSSGDLLLWRFPAAARSRSADARRQAWQGRRRAVGGRRACWPRWSMPTASCSPPTAVRRARAGRATRIRRALRFTDLVEVGEDGQMRLARRGRNGAADARRPSSRSIRGEDGGAGHLPAVRRARSRACSTAANLQALLDMLPIGLALVDRDGRFLTMNKAFRQAAGIKGAAMPVLSRRSGRQGRQGGGGRRGPAQCPRPGDVGRPRDPARRASRPSRSR